MVNREVNTNHRDEDKFFNGFIPLWALTLFCMAIMFLVIFIAGLICHLAGCRTLRKDLTNNTYSSIVQQPLLPEYNQPETALIQSNILLQNSRDAVF